MALKTIKSFGVKGIVPLSMLDWEGRLVSTIFLGGCNFRCPFCHNSQLVTGYKDLPDTPWNELRESFISKGGWLDGVCITGGEPTINNDLADLARHIQNLDLQVKLDTNGTRPKVLKDLIDDRLINAVALDIKTSFPRYTHATRSSDLTESIRESIDALIEAEVQGHLEVEFRTTVVPTIVGHDEILGIASYLRDKGAKRYVLQQFNPKTVLAAEAGAIRPFKPDVLAEIAEESSKVLPTYLRG